MSQRLVDLRIEGIALLPVDHQPEPAERGLQRVRDRLEAAGQLAVFPCLVDGVEHREQPGQRAGHRLLAYGGPVPVHALAVVGVLGLQALQVGGPLREPRLGVGLRPGRGGRLLEDALQDLHVSLLRRHVVLTVRAVLRAAVLRAVLRLGWPGGLGRRPAGTTGAGPLRRRVLPPDLPGHRVDAPAVVDDRAGARLLRCWHQAAPPSLASSSTISASTTSSSAGVWLLSSAEPDCELAWAA